MSHKPVFSNNTIWNTFTSKIILGLSARENNEYMQLLANKVSDLAPIRKSRSSFHYSSEFGNIYYYQDKEIMNGGGEQDDDNKTSNDQHQHQHLLQLSSISVQNKVDLGELLISQYHLSNLSLTEFISSSKLLAEIRKHRHIDTAQKTVVENMLINYIKAYSKYIEEPVPNSRNEFSRNFRFFDDKIDIILAYLSKINQFIGQYGLNQTGPLQFDIYFAPPSAHNDFDNLLSAESMVKSVPTKRFHHAAYASGLDEIHSFLGSKPAERLLGFGQSQRKCRNNSRLILLIIRKNERNTKKDSLYLLKQTLDNEMYSNPVYEYNEFLWKLNSKQDVIKSKLNVNDKYQYDIQKKLFCISYHLRPNQACKKYFYFNGYGQQICKRDIINKMPLLFEDKDNKNQISNDILNEYQYGEFQDYIDENDDHFQFGKYLFGLTYSVKALSKRSRQQIITFPKNILQNKLNQIAEFVEQSQLYYYLTWTHKMQLVDNSFLCYTFNDGHIAIFNTELHDKATQHELFAVAVPNDTVHGNRRNVPKWRMNHFMDAQQIKEVYGINPSHLPKGSRTLRDFFQPEIHQNTRSLSPHIDVQNWRNVETIRSQQFKHRYTPRINRSELNTAIKQSIGKIQRSELELIPILNIDLKNDEIRVNSLIPIQIKNQWIAVSFKKLPIRPFKTVVTGLYIDCDDIINKASLVDPKALQTFQWLKYSPFQTRKSFNQYYQQCKPSVSAVTHHQNDQNDSSLPSMETAKSVQSNSSHQSIQSIQSLPSIQSIQSIQTNPKMHSTPNSTSNTDNSLDLGRQLNDALRGNNVMAAMLKQKDDIISQQSQQILRQSHEIQTINQQLQAMRQTIHRLQQQQQQPSSARTSPGNVRTPSISTICTNSPLPSAPNSAAISYNLNIGFPPILPVPPSAFVDILPTSRPGSNPGSPPVSTLNLAYNSPPVTPPMPFNLTQSSAIPSNWAATQINAQNNRSININLGRNNNNNNNGQNYQ